NEALVAAQERRTNKQEDLEKKLVELKEIISRTEKDEEKLLAVSEKQQKKIEERLLKAYQKIRNTYRNGLAVVSVERNACGGCYNAIPPQLQMEIGLTKKILVCEHCGRILVDKATILEEETTEA
ncbi:MAG TPA: C4-type zinc ribbon domain-containing protein, partial [Saprospiraceae bacterium]|nr:C4-type zinc ribbon domain-containing protein [Saprospiraceae bacterium]